MKLVVGLGNPGTKYLFTRHNIGFMVIDRLAKASTFQKKHKSLLLKTQIESQTVLLAKPQTYMNLSGEAVFEVAQFYKIPAEDILIIQDDKDLNFLTVKFQKSRGHGGHNGIKNIHEQLKTDTYARLKLGVQSVDQKNSMISTSDFVLAPFHSKEMEQLPQFLNQAEQAVLCFLKEDFESASNKFNQKV